MIYLATASDMVRFGEEVIVPLAGIFFLFGLPVLAFVFFRVLRHRERLEMIRHGIDPGFSKQMSRVSASSNFEAARRNVPAHSDEAAQTALRKGITLSFIGLAITIGLSFVGYHRPSTEIPGFVPPATMDPGPWLLGGLVPMFVGLAQVVIAMLSGATLRPGIAAGAASAPERATTPQPSAANFDGPYAYRPGDTQELRPPTAPPERRL